MIKKMFLLFIFVILILFFVTCSSSDEDSDETPLLTSISPSSKAVNMPGFTLTAEGAGFTEFSKIYFNNTRMETTFVNKNELQCEIASSMISAVSFTGEKTGQSMDSGSELPVTINNGGGNFSEKLYFTLRDNNSFYNLSVITNGAVNSFNPAIAVAGTEKIYIVYERYDENGGIYYVSVLTSVDGGLDWEGPRDIYSSEERIYNPSIDLGDEKNIYITFFCEKLFFTTSGDSGETWSDPLALSAVRPSPIESAISYDTPGVVSVMWLIPFYSSDPSIYFQRSVDSGATFSPAKNISTDKDYFNHVYNPSFDTNGSLIYTAWTAWPAGGSRYSFSYFNYSLDGGLTWGSKDRYFGVTSAPYLTAGEGSKVTMAVSSSYLPFQNRIALYSSDDSGASWKTGVAVTSESSDHNPLLKIDSSGNINILFKRGNEYLYTRSIDGGISWTEPLFVTDRISSEYQKKLIDMGIGENGDLYIVSEFENSGILYFTRSH